MALVSEIELIQKAKQGEVISFPTDTVAALAAQPDFLEQFTRSSAAH